MPQKQTRLTRIKKNNMKGNGKNRSLFVYSCIEVSQ